MKHLIHGVCVYGLMAAASLAAEECRDPKLRDEINKMVVEDQQTRQGGSAHIQSKAEAAETARIDAIHAKRVREIVNEVGWPGVSLVGSEGAHGMWLLVQHFNLADQDQYLPLIEKAVAQKEASPKDFAFLVDRVRLEHGHKQIYGTQYLTVREGEWVRRPLEDPDRVDERRKSVGLVPILEYENSLQDVKVVPNPAGEASEWEPWRAGTNQAPAVAGQNVFSVLAAAAVLILGLVSLSAFLFSKRRELRRRGLGLFLLVGACLPAMFAFTIGSPLLKLGVRMGPTHHVSSWSSGGITLQGWQMYAVVIVFALAALSMVAAGTYLLFRATKR
jgi:hypothetical protein